MGKAEERGWFHCAGLCEENLIWFEGMPVVIGDKSMAAGFFGTMCTTSMVIMLN